MADILTIFPIAKKLIFNSSINLLTDTIKVALLNGYIYNPTHNYWSDVSSYEIAPTGTYFTGGTALASKTIEIDIVDEEGYFDAADLVLGTGMTANFQQIIIYKDTGTASTSPLIGCIVKDSMISLVSQECSISWSNDGIMRFL